MYLHLRLNRKTRIDPSLQAAKESGDARIAIMQKDERRTGAGMFFHSGAVRNDPLIFIELQAFRIRFDLAKLNVDRSGNVTGLKRSGAAHIHDDGRPAVEGGFCLLDGEARHLGLGERKPERCRYGGLSGSGLSQLCATG